jgi:hypothetical protein
MRDNALTDKLGDRNARFYGFLSNYPAYDTAGTESRYFLDLGLPVELGFIPPAYGFMTRPGKCSGGVKKETLQQERLEVWETSIARKELRT